MKASSRPEPLYTFRYPNLGYAILLLPHTPADRTKIKREARSGRQSLQDYAGIQSLTRCC
jgi:hypothetical protein